MKAITLVERVRFEGFQIEFYFYLTFLDGSMILHFRNSKLTFQFKHLISLPDINPHSSLTNIVYTGGTNINSLLKSFQNFLQGGGGLKPDG